MTNFCKSPNVYQSVKSNIRAIINLRTIFAKLIIFSLCSSHLAVISGYLTPVQAQDTRAVTVTADQPNIWTLEQAHYLLAQLHRRNLDLKAKRLGDLDANEINGINIDLLKSIMDVSATYDDAARVTNGLTRQDKTFNADRRRQLIGDIDKLEREKLEYTKTIAVLKREYETAESDEEKAKIQAKINEQIEIKTEIESQIESKRGELGGLNSAGGTLTNTASTTQGSDLKIPGGSLDTEIKAKIAQALAGFTANPQLNASLQLDKFVQLQYEIISKQLTLLRDEVGPGEQLLFLELPQSINAAYNKSDGMWAQSRWRIGGFSRCEFKINGERIPCHKLLYNDRNQNRQPRTTLEIYESITGTDKSSFNLLDNLALTLSDIKNQKALAVRFVAEKLIDNSQNKERKDSVFKYLANKYNIGFNEAEKTEISKYQILLTDFDGKKKKADDARKLRNKECEANPSNCSITKEIPEIREFKEAEEALSEPSKILLNVILRYLNSVVDDSQQLSKGSSISLPYVSSRSDFLSRFDARDEPTKKLFNRLWLEDLFFEELHKLQESDFEQGFYDLNSPINLSKFTKADKPIDNRSVRTIELIPRQSSLNVNDIKVRNKSSVFNFVASTLFGLGGNFSYRQQRENYSQFVQQELYSSGFGKGAREFGWTFTEMPGSDRLLSGTRNTYAVVVVPKEATSILVESVGCAFKRSAAQPKNFEDASTRWLDLHDKNNCSESKNFVIPIPGGGYDANNDFYVSGLTYEPADKGKRIMVSINGSNFSSQIGVLIDGTPLPASIGIAQNFIRDDSLVGKEYLGSIVSEKIKGSFERVDSGQIILSFEAPERDSGTPIITLVAPGKAVDLNSLSNLYINGNRNTSLKSTDWMFGSKPSSDFKVTDTQMFVSKNAGEEISELTVLLTGSSFSGITNVFVNGVDPVQCVNPDAKFACPENIFVGTRGYWGRNNVYKMTFPPPKDEKIRIVLVNGSDIIKLPPIANPAKIEKQKEPPSLKPDDLSFSVKQVIPMFTDEKKLKISYILVELTGKGFSSEVATSVGELNVISDTKAFLTITDPKPAQTVKLTDHKKNIYAAGVVEISDIIKPAQPKPPAPAPNPAPAPTQ